jgi:indole-3-glycerol phosphate synthase
MSDFLSAMAASSRLRAERVKARIGMRGLRSRADSAHPTKSLVLDPSGFDLIAETKLASPSRGRIAGPSDDVKQVVVLAEGMARSGAAAISVLTEPDSFDGSIEHLEAVASRVDIPVMRKDFLVDPIQILEARAHGASGVLLIARITGESKLIEMTDLALELGMFVLVEIFEEVEVDVASAVFDRMVLVGVNARDLSTLKVDRSRHAELFSKLPSHLPAVAESGITTADQAAECSRLGYRLALVGSSLVVAGSARNLTREMIEAGR